MLEHCQIAGAVAKALLQRMLPFEQELFPAQADAVARVHDIGKACPTFQKKIHQAAKTPFQNAPELAAFDPQLERTWGGHGAVTQATLLGCNAPPHVAETAGQHHGALLPQKPYDCAAFGGQLWHELRCEILTRLLGSTPDTPVWPEIQSPEQARLVAGLTTVADWISSGSQFDDPAQAWTQQVDNAVLNAGFSPLRIRRGLRFEDIFPFPPKDVQRQFVEQIKAPGVYVLEAPMGMGKTEAALFAAYRMLDKRLSSGIYFALPTQLTSNCIYSRLQAFLRQILEDDSLHRAHLLHAKAWLVPWMFQEMGDEAAANGSWFAGKRGILAPFAAGTVDQALMAVMRVRHSVVRAYGLAGKTVILDEVHSYDGYTGVILDALVHLLRQYHCTVIILSATLTAERRASLIGEQSALSAYPLITCSPNSGSATSLPCVPVASGKTAIVHCHDESEAFEEVLCRAEAGQQVLWIENTVKEAQEIFRRVAARAAEMRVQAGLVHSRFTPADRFENEKYWTTIYGKNADERTLCGRILVGTQVLEQSLDIDADFLVTRFCPTDMLLQRMGRLWRHETTPRPHAARREAWLLCPPLDSMQKEPKKCWGVTGYVYAPYVLCRSLDVWSQRTEVTLPDDIRELLEATYAERAEHDASLAALLYTLNRERDGLRSLALSGLATASTTLSDERATTRVGQRPEVDVLLLRHVDTATGHVTLANGTRLVLPPGAKKDWKERQEIAAMLTMNMVRVPEKDAPAAVHWKSLQWLHPWLYCGYDESGTAWLRVAVIGPDDSIKSLAGTAPHDRVILYSKIHGYMLQ